MVKDRRFTSLDLLAVGQNALVDQLNDSADVAVRLMEMGFVPGTPVRVVRVAPLGDPIDVLVRGYHLSLRRSEASHVKVALDPEEGSSR